MANRYMTRNYMTMEKAPVAIYGKVAIGATGAPTLNALSSLGVKTIARNAAGKYTITFGGPVGTDTYKKLLMFSATPVVSTTSAVVACNVVADNSASGNIVIQFVSVQGTGADPASGEIILFEAILSNYSGNA